MTRKEKLALRQHQSTRQLMGMQGIASHGITTSNSELVFFLIRPDNLSVLSSEGIRARVTALANLLRAGPAVELIFRFCTRICFDSAAGSEGGHERRHLAPIGERYL